MLQKVAEMGTRLQNVALCRLSHFNFVFFDLFFNLIC